MARFATKTKKLKVPGESSYFCWCENDLAGHDVIYSSMNLIIQECNYCSSKSIKYYYVPAYPVCICLYSVPVICVCFYSVPVYPCIVCLHILYINLHITVICVYINIFLYSVSVHPCNLCLQYMHVHMSQYSRYEVSIAIML